MEEIFKDNVIILYEALECAVSNYVTTSHSQNEMRYVHAYLSATMNSIAEFLERFPDALNEQECKACRGANNSLKHDKNLITHVEPKGGLTFPIEFPAQFSAIHIVWKKDSISCNWKNQAEAFEKIFAGKDVIETLAPIVMKIKAYPI